MKYHRCPNRGRRCAAGETSGEAVSHLGRKSRVDRWDLRHRNRHQDLRLEGEAERAVEAATAWTAALALDLTWKYMAGPLVDKGHHVDVRNCAKRAFYKV